MVKDVSHEELIKRINEKKAVLAIVSKKLKKKFVGLDDIIDSIIENISVWYIMPELVTRPVIVCLWGMTGVGKTDLVRSLVRELKFSEKFIEMQLSNKGSIGYNSLVQEVLDESPLETGEPGILLLDEMQRFRYIDKSGMEIQDCKFQDLWTLLSDGKFTNNAGGKLGLLKLLFETKYDQQYAEERVEDDEESTDETRKQKRQKNKERQLNREYKRSYYSAIHLKKQLRLTEEVEQIMKWDSDKKMNMITVRLKSNDLCEGDSYEKLLIFIAGNIDEAYSMSKAVSDADNDADVFHDFSSRINIINIKNALTKRFQPEQISRFGNTHIIYPSISKKNYQKIIRKSIKEIVDNVKKYHKVEIKINKSVHECVYRNGVFPTQGVRPVFSTISSILRNSIPNFILYAIENDIKIIYLRNEGDYIIAKIGDEEHKYFVDCVIDKIKKENSLEGKMLSSVHEAGHAVMYSLLLGLSPTQIKSNISSAVDAAFTGIHPMVGSKKNILDEIKIAIAGQVAEKMVFGDDYITNGSCSDITFATNLASGYVRKWAMGDYDVSIRAAECGECASGTNNDIDRTNVVIDKMLSDGISESKKILEENIDFFQEVSDVLFKMEKIDPIDFKKIALKHNIEIEILSPKKKVYNDYIQKYADFKANRKLNGCKIKKEEVKKDIKKEIFSQKV